MEKTKNKVVAFGELLFRMTPYQEHQKVSDARLWKSHFAGAESNVITSLSKLGNEVFFTSKFPHNPIGQSGLESLQQYGINTEYVLLGGGRMGVYYIETGLSIRPSKVTYDRKYSSFSEIEENEFDWKEILKGKDWLYLGGISPALSENCAKETIKAAKTANELGVGVCFDLNFRRSLWSDVSSARNIYNEILDCTDLLFANEGSFEDVYSIRGEGKNVLERNIDLIENVANKYSIKQIGFTIRNHSSASENELSGLFYTDGKTSDSISYKVQIKDRFGTGDAFAAGILHGIINNWEAQKVVNFATAAFALKHTIPGDQHTSDEKEIHSIMKGNISGHVER
ncbi:MAG: sugar kinase [Reichenbachiella sp.]